MFEWSVPLWADAGIFLLAALLIGVAGTKAAGYADRVADKSGLGEALTGTVFLGFMTALPGLVASVTAALKGEPGLAYSNAIGGVAVQTAALAVADLAYPRANLEHAAASAANMMQAVLLIFLLTLALAAIPSPDVTFGHVHPVTLILFPAAAASFWLAYRTWEKPMWQPTQTRETVEDRPAPGHEKENLTRLISVLSLAAAATAVAGAVIAESAQNLVEETDLSPAVVGGLFMALATSLPELVTSIAAVRRGALTLAVSDIVGGNFFDVLFVAAADLAYLKGSLYHQPDIGASDLFMTAVTILMNVTLLMGLIYRQKKGPANIGFESVGILLLYAAGFTIVAVGMD